jgi:integrase/recombinase XerD
MWAPQIKSYKAYLQLEKSLSDNSVEAYLRDVEKLTQYLQQGNQKTCSIFFAGSASWE